ncbi:4-carboxymuconolactone decarboxylase [Psilocybe cubensis]|uniref:Carboxymuconolactone decarboxylase-like domain-containing protein n=2 Tax=Psilocybe cubensis TaxID=181762 RepID=A0A8H8CMX2_PSICU|nr:4-carboxymuconolactone decarboxylase [Psilocybe cubensis]KAH9484929.1 4-carboxymuconolactone decarboxylase [Psilocybe cubensis]
MSNEDAHKELFDAGIVIRRKVMGDDYVDNQLRAGVSEFMKPMQELVTEAAWGTIWTRPGLELKQRSLIVIALLASQGKEAELTGHIRGAVNNGATEIEIRETLLHVAGYCGAPSGMWAFRVGDAAIKKLKEEGKLPQ